jgi:hypothetical protein
MSTMLRIVCRCHHMFLSNGVYFNRLEITEDSRLETSKLISKLFLIYLTAVKICSNAMRTVSRYSRSTQCLNSFCIF